MKEKLAIGLLGAVIGAAISVSLAVWVNWFATSKLSNAMSNEFGIIAGPGLVAALAMGIWVRWTRTCAVPYCLRLGEHPVSATCKKVCTQHHTRQHHLFVHTRHKHPLGWGRSHNSQPRS